MIQPNHIVVLHWKISGLENTEISKITFLLKKYDNRFSPVLVKKIYPSSDVTYNATKKCYDVKLNSTDVAKLPVGTIYAEPYIELSGTTVIPTVATVPVTVDNTIIDMKDVVNNV